MGKKHDADPPASERQNPKEPAEAAPSRSKDAILIRGISEDGESMAVLRAREDRLEAGVLRTVKEGQPLSGELVKLTPRPEFPLLCDVEVQVPAGALNAPGASDDAARERRSTRGRPAQVATNSYRQNWDLIWSKPHKKTLAN